MTRAEQAQRTRQGVLETARRLFAEQGYAATSLQRIADAMGVRKANVYYYFPTKAAILDALLDERVLALEALLDAVEAEPETDVRRRLLVEGFVDEVVTAHRTIAPVDFADPAVRSVSAVAERLDALTARASAVLFGPHPSVDDRAALAVVLDLKPVLRRLGGLPDDQLRGALRRLCLRLLPVDPDVDPDATARGR
ncbi:MAG: helix-turn-helix domain-containing protein [Microbacteriaceae bacterium]